jgi:hypothetical protein
MNSVTIGLEAVGRSVPVQRPETPSTDRYTAPAWSLMLILLIFESWVLSAGVAALAARLGVWHYIAPFVVLIPTTMALRQRLSTSAVYLWVAILGGSSGFAGSALSSLIRAMIS